jgi:hypothetical protein
MMLFSVMSASRPLQKAYKLVGKKLEHDAYPMVKNFTSASQEVKNLKDLFGVVKAAADTGACLLKGKLHRDLKNESRAGATSSSDATEWVCLDIDGIGATDIDSFLKLIGLDDIQYVLQWSSSQGLTDNLLHAHVFMLLDTPRAPAELKLWLMGLNFMLPETSFKLTRTNCALHWPLDITVGQNDKLLYVAPPKLGAGITDPFAGKDRISLVADKWHKKTHIAFPSLQHRAVYETRAKELLSKFRDAAGMPKNKKLALNTSGAVEYLANPDHATVTSIKHERGFVYFNLNGGDSWGYFHPEGHPQYISNFKGEPKYKTSELLPEYWASAQMEADKLSVDASSDERKYFVFRDKRKQRFYEAVYDPKPKALGVSKFDLQPVNNEKAARDFLEEHHVQAPTTIPECETIWDPHMPAETIIKDRAAGYLLNTYFDTPAFAKAKKMAPGSCSLKDFSNIADLISWVIGGDADLYDDMINWLSDIAHSFMPTQAAWLLHGTQGTGKGQFYEHILKGLFGSACVSIGMNDLESAFNSFIEAGTVLVFLDEVDLSSKQTEASCVRKMKRYITESSIRVNRKYEQEHFVHSRMNFILASNELDAWLINNNDRRYHIGVQQEKPWYDRDRAKIAPVLDKIDKELPAFTRYLLDYPCDHSRAGTPRETDAKKLMQDLSDSSARQLSIAIQTGDLAYLVDLLPDNVNGLSPLQATSAAPFLAIMKQIIGAPGSKPAVGISRDECMAVFDYCDSGKTIKMGRTRFTQYVKRLGMTMYPKAVKRGDHYVCGNRVKWRYDPQELTEWQKQVKAGWLG